jgi:uncharacterized protein
MTHYWNRKTCVVCGASSGLGLQLVEELVREGAEVTMVARHAERLERSREGIIDRYPSARIHCLAYDLCSLNATEELSGRIQEHSPRLDLVINAVGQSDRGTVSQLTSERLLELFQTNVISSLHAARVLAPLLRSGRESPHVQIGRGGVLVLIGSLSCHFAPRFLGGYSIVKHGVAALAQQARLELAEEGIHVMLASPGPIARHDSGLRYGSTPQAGDLPPAALQGGGGAKLRGLDARWLSQQILEAAAKRKRVLMLPRIARLLAIVTAISPAWGDYLLRRRTT